MTIDAAPRHSDKDSFVENEGMRTLQEALFEGSDPSVRQMASIFLGMLADPRATSLLIAALRDPEKDVRARATQALAKIGSPAVDQLVAALEDEDWTVRYRAAEALGLIGDPAAFDPLVAALQDGKDHVRYMAAKGLGKLGDGRAAAHLIARLHDGNEFVRRSAVRALGAVGGDEAIRALAIARERETSDGVRAAIDRALNDARTRTP